MATDGVKIIDGDLAHDTYWGFMDLYDQGMPLEQIQQQIERGKEAYDSFEYEIFITAYALALWETGQLSDDVRQQVREALDQGACAKVWARQSQADANARERELARFWNRINTPKPKPRQRKKYRKIVHLLFSEGDLLAFQLPDGSWCLTLVWLVSQYRGRCSYAFAMLTYRDHDKPELDDIHNYCVLGRKVPSGVEIDWAALLREGMDKINEQGGPDAILMREAQRTGQYFIGLDVIGVEHQALKRFAGRFEKIGRLAVKPESRRCGSESGEIDFEGFQRQFDSLMESRVAFKSELFPIQDFLASLPTNPSETNPLQTNR